MASTRLWDRAALVPVRRGERRAEIAVLPAGLPTVEELFTFMRDAERRFETLKMRIEERTFGARGEQVVAMDVAMRHPGHARVVTTETGRGTTGSHELWISDGEVVRTFSAAHKLGTSRPVRNRPRGLKPGDYPGFATIYEPITPLPMETLAELFVHPGGYCQNVLATGRCWISGTDRIGGREAIVVECDHPRAVETEVDRPDYHVQVAVDRLEGIVTRLVESVGDEVTRVAEVVHIDPDAALPPTTFEFEFPEGTTVLY
jgi:outer membrane lipoprotein-sorting protein